MPRFPQKEERKLWKGIPFISLKKFQLIFMVNKKGRGNKIFSSKMYFLFYKFIFIYHIYFHTLYRKMEISAVQYLPTRLGFHFS